MPESGLFRLGAAQVDLPRVLGLTPEKISTDRKLVFEGTVVAERVGQLGGHRQVYSSSSASEPLIFVGISLEQSDSIPYLQVPCCR